jgi:hypothetical protein
MKELTFQDAIALLKQEELQHRAMFIAYDDCDAMHASKELSTAIAMLERVQCTTRRRCC